MSVSGTCEINHPAISFAMPDGEYYASGCPLCERNQMIAELNARIENLISMNPEERSAAMKKELSCYSEPSKNESKRDSAS